MNIIFDRKPFTDWVIMIKERYNDKDQEILYADRGILGGILDFNEFTGTYRTGTRDGKECEMFTLMARDAEYAYLWVNIFKNGNVEYVSHIPSVININKKSKQVEILPLVHCKYNKTTRTFEFTYQDEHRSNYNIVFK